MQIVGTLWAASAVVMLVVGLKAYGGNAGLSTLLLGFGILAVGPALWLILAFGLVGSDKPDERRPGPPKS